MRAAERINALEERVTRLEALLDNRRSRDLLTLAEAAQELGISTEAIRMRIRRGRLNAQRRNGRIYLRASEVREAADDEQ